MNFATSSSPWPYMYNIGLHDQPVCTTYELFSHDRPIAQSAHFKMKVKDDNFDHRPKNLDEVDDLQWTADQEILLLYSLHGYKPVGKFLVLAHKL